MSVRARMADGSWAPVLELGIAPHSIVEQLWSGDISGFLDLEGPAAVISSRPDLPGSPDAICMTPLGELLVVVAVGDEEPREVTRRLRQIVAALSGQNLIQFMDACNAIGAQHTPGSWAVERFGSGDAVSVDRCVELRLASGEITLLVAARAGYRHVALPVIETRTTTTANVRCFELVLLGAGTVPMVDATEVAETALLSAARDAERASDALRMLQAVELELGAHALPLVEAMLGHCEAFYADLSFRARGDVVIVAAFLDPGATDPILEIDSAGSVHLRLHALDPMDRRFLTESIAAIVDDETVDILRSEPLEMRLSLMSHLADISLVEQFVGALSDAFLSTMCNEMAAEQTWQLRAA